jgi:uncharacterized protein (TIGR00369 family)
MDPAALKSDGWTTIEPSGFSTVVSPIWIKREGADAIVGIMIEQRHCNTHIGTAHGGLLMTFADISLGLVVSHTLGGKSCATLQLQTQFVATARTGEFLTCRPEVIRITSQIVFVRGLIRAGDKTVASAEGMWKVLEPRAKE